MAQKEKVCERSELCSAMQQEVDCHRPEDPSLWRRPSRGNEGIGTSSDTYLFPLFVVRSILKFIQMLQHCAVVQLSKNSKHVSWTWSGKSLWTVCFHSIVLLLSIQTNGLWNIDSISIHGCWMQGRSFGNGLSSQGPWLWTEMQKACLCYFLSLVLAASLGSSVSTKSNFHCDNT